MRQTAVEPGWLENQEIRTSAAVRQHQNFVLFSGYVNELKDTTPCVPLSFFLYANELFSSSYLRAWFFFVFRGCCSCSRDLIAMHRSQHTPANLHKFLRIYSQILYANSSALFANHVPRATPLSITELISTDANCLSACR